MADDRYPETAPDYVLAHKWSIYHREQIEKSEICGCFYCLAIFQPSAIERWTDNGTTAFCPHCDIDSVIGAASGYPIDTAFLEKMRQHWFDA